MKSENIMSGMLVRYEGRLGTVKHFKSKNMIVVDTEFSICTAHCDFFNEVILTEFVIKGLGFEVSKETDVRDYGDEQKSIAYEKDKFYILKSENYGYYFCRLDLFPNKKSFLVRSSRQINTADQLQIMFLAHKGYMLDFNHDAL